MNDEGVYRTAPVTPGLLTRWHSEGETFLMIKLPFSSGQKCEYCILHSLHPLSSSQLPPMLAHSIFSDTEALKKVNTNSSHSQVKINKHQVLLYHVVPGAHALSSLTNDLTLTPEEGAALRPEEQPALRVNLYKKGQKDMVTVNGALVEKEIVASNGVILVISSFLHPRPTYTIADVSIHPINCYKPNPHLKPNHHLPPDVESGQSLLVPQPGPGGGRAQGHLHDRSGQARVS